MSLDKKKIKEKLEKERDVLLEEVRDMGKLNPETFADYEEKSSMIRDLGARLNNILRAIKGINRESFGKCEVCKKNIEMARLEANPAARTCKEHLNG